MPLSTARATDPLIAELDAALSQFVKTIADEPLPYLIRRLLVTIELEGEAERQSKARQYRKQVAMIEAVGRFRFASFDDEVAKAAEGCGDTIA